MREETPLAPFLCCVLCLGARVTRAHVRTHLVVDLIYQYSFHPQIRNVYFLLALDGFFWTHGPFYGVLSAVRSSPPKTLPTASAN